MKSGSHLSRERLPEYLQTYVVEQDWDRYTPREHATWRYIMRQAREFFREHAHHSYLDGLEKTGIPISEIPRIEDMDARLQELGWGAVCVCGFIPPLAFLDFQSRRILPIAADMRSLEHLLYTPAPDIVHEAAGHAPILADPDFANYLTQYASLARRAIFSREDIKLYEAIRGLSDTKENPDSTPQEIAAAEEALLKASAGVTWVSEAHQVARMNWWTAEYGLIGPPENPKIYGAGLLSSLGEGRNCLSDEVKKIPLSLRCIEQTYDITRPQPQLFVAESFTQLTDLLSELGSSMAFSRGGHESLLLAKRAETVTTTVLDSGLGISGVLSGVRTLLQNGMYLQWQGPVQLSVADMQLSSQGTERHAHGFSGCIGRWQACPDRDPAFLNDRELVQLGIKNEQPASITLSSGVRIRGTVLNWVRSHGKLVVITWDNCTVSLGDEILYKPEWGHFDQPVGCEVVSVYGGPADRQSYGPFFLGKASTTPGRSSPFTSKERELFNLYQQVKELRTQLNDISSEKFASLHEQLCLATIERFPREWLLGIELIELSMQATAPGALNFSWLKELKATVANPAHYDAEVQNCLRGGLKAAGIADY
jgi:phenylalanine-4-hydroxylase